MLRGNAFRNRFHTQPLRVDSVRDVPLDHPARRRRIRNPIVAGGAQKVEEVVEDGQDDGRGCASPRLLRYEPRRLRRHFVTAGESPGRASGTADCRLTAPPRWRTVRSHRSFGRVWRLMWSRHVVSVGLVHAVLAFSAAVSPLASQTAPRERISINDGWRFQGLSSRARTSSSRSRCVTRGATVPQTRTFTTARAYRRCRSAPTTGECAQRDSPSCTAQ